ncbi:MAG: rhomboid family intramembrane serine protease [Candidatus Nanohalarchaeota archaeon]|nr:MAG: rhomboid family intramembrane serine protease [Candidatus Nanohaloarchaeota archaeon]
MFEKTRQFFPYEDMNKPEHKPIITIALIITNIIIFLWSLTNFKEIIYTYGFTAANPTLTTTFTSMFLHGGFGHIIGNMWYLWLFGDNIEDKFGKIKYIAIYASSGILAVATQYLTDPTSQTPVIGASGAISGILGAYLILFPKVKVKTIGPFYQIYRIKAKYLIALWFAIQLILGTISIITSDASNIAFFAHVGGFIFGLFAGLLHKMIITKNSTN